MASCSMNTKFILVGKRLILTLGANNQEMSELFSIYDKQAVLRCVCVCVYVKGKKLF